MAKINLPYQLREGDKAYATRLMANLEALAGKLNRVSLPGLPDTDIERALTELKLLLDAEYAADAKVIASFGYDAVTNQLVIGLKNGASYRLTMTPFVNDYYGAAENGLQVTVDGNRKISAQLQPGAVAYQVLDTALQALIDGKVTANTAGNAAAIRFADGESMQDKLENGALTGPAGVSVALNSLFYFRVDAMSGHLLVGVAEGAPAPPFSIDAEGHLLYTID